MLISAEYLRPQICTCEIDEHIQIPSLQWEKAAPVHVNHDSGLDDDASYKSY